ncbi:MAG: hypothetical protein ACREF1_09190, partial [Acetobacteraceae bacterium]
MRIVSKRMMLMAGVFLSSGLMLGAASAQTTASSGSENLQTMQENAANWVMPTQNYSNWRYST